MAVVTSPTISPAVATQPEPLPANIRSIQPGGGTVQVLELGWGKLRRWWLKKFRPNYVRKMQSLVRGDPSQCPVEVIDDRDLKFFRNICRCWIEKQDDAFAWRERLPVARAGLGELVICGLPCLVATIALASGIAGSAWWGSLPVAALAYMIFFFRDPQRKIPQEKGVVVSPADGKIVDISWIPPEPTDSVSTKTGEVAKFIGEDTVKIGIFLSLFNVHINRSAFPGRVIRLRYQPGKFINAMRSSSAEKNEHLELFLEEPAFPRRRFVIRQIAGAIARRIVCEARPGQTLATGEKFGMIKFGSRTEILLPARNFDLLAKVGDTVQGGLTRLGHYNTQNEGD